MIISRIFLLVIGLYFLYYSLLWLWRIVRSFQYSSNQKLTSSDIAPGVLIVLPAYKPGPIFKAVLDAVEVVANRSRNVNVYVLLQEAESVYEEYARSKGFMIDVQNFDASNGNTYQQALRFIAAKLQSFQLGAPEFVMILDKDNVVDTSFFDNIPANAYFLYDIIQGRRAAHMVTTPVAFFDQMSEKLNDRMFRAAQVVNGAMVEVSGSAALIEADLFCKAVTALDPLAPGFDKNFMVQLLIDRRLVRTTYLSQCVVLEEKTREISSHAQQRTRWFGEQYYNAFFSALRLLSASFKFHRFGPLGYLLMLWRPPRSLQVCLLPLLTLFEVYHYVVFQNWPVGFPVFSFACVITYSAVAIFLLAERSFVTALRYAMFLPLLAAKNLFSALRGVFGRNRAQFIHTNHHL